MSENEKREVERILEKTLNGQKDYILRSRLYRKLEHYFIAYYQPYNKNGGFLNI